MKNLVNTELNTIKQNLSKSAVELPSGKMVRSSLGILIIKALKTEYCEKYSNFLTAIELIHNASLIHDDVIDNEEIRRNKKTLNNLTDNKSAVLYGDILLTEAVEYILKTKSMHVMSIINTSVKNMCKGEIIQKTQEFQIPSIEDYIHKTELKTASLFTGMMSGIAELSNCSNKTELISFALNFGIAFQIKNDLDNSGSDIKNGIYTTPVIYSNSIDITESAIEKTHGLIDNYTRKAICALDFLGKSDYKESLIGAVKCLNK